jgi:hypothetical protein
MILYRPVGMKELELIAESGFTAFPPRLPEQPIFYPILNLEYANQIARDWNTKDEASGYAGFVTRFEIDDVYAGQYEAHQVGNAANHRELWVPAESLKEFNQHIKGKIQIVRTHYGIKVSGKIDATTNLPEGIARKLMK